MKDRKPSTRERIYHLVNAYALRTRVPTAIAWDKLFRAYQFRSNTRWDRIAHNNGYTQLDAIHALRRLDELLDCARETFATETTKEVSHG